MELKTETTRITKIVLTEDEIKESLRMYLSSKNIIDTDKGLEFGFIDTRSEEGVKLNVLLKNYNKDNDIEL